MKRQLPFLVFALTAVLASARSLAQEPLPPPETAAAVKSVADKPLIPLDLQIVVSRYQGDKEISSLPFSLAVNANDPITSQVRMGANVPVPATLFTPRKDSGPTTMQPWNYQDVGTAIDCNAKALDDGRFHVWISVEDSSVYANVQDGTTPSVPEVPVLRSFKSKNTVLLKDGQTRQFTAATDRVNGEVVRIDVTLRVVK